jgi:hypothetical protein
MHRRTIAIIDARCCNVAPVDVSSTARSRGNRNEEADPTIHNVDLSSKLWGRREGKGGPWRRDRGRRKGKKGWEMQRPLFEHLLVGSGGGGRL